MNLRRFKFSDLRMEYQIIFFDLVILIFALALLIGAYQIQQQIVMDIIETSSQTILKTSDKKNIQLNLLNLKNYLDSKTSILMHTGVHISEFLKYSFLNNNKYTILPSYYYCVDENDISVYQIQYNSPIFCQAINNEIILDDENQMSIYRKSISLLNQFGLEINIFSNQFLVIEDMPQQDYFAFFYHAFILDLQPPKLKWFINFQQQYQNNPNKTLYFGLLYQAVRNNNFYLPLNVPIKDNQNDLVGIVNQLISVYDDQIATNQFNVFLLNYQAEVIVSSFNPQIFNQNKTLIYNETFTGFNLTDWQQVMQYQYNDYTNNTLTLYNKYFKSEIIVAVCFFKDTNFTLIVFTNVTLEQQIQIQQQDLIQTMQVQFIEAIQIQLGVCGSLIIVASFIVHTIFKPLMFLMINIKKYILSTCNSVNFEITRILHDAKKQQNIFQKLLSQFLQFKDMIIKTGKSHTCQIIESYEYHKKWNNTKLKINEQIEQIQNQYQSPKKSSGIWRQRKTMITPLLL